MKSLRFSLLTGAIICISYLGVAGQGYRITLKVPDLPNKNVILSHRLGLKFYTDDTVKTDFTGTSVFEGMNPMPGGMYQLVFPDKKFCEFFLDKNQTFGVTTRAGAPTDSLSFQDSPENSRFLEWQQKYTKNRTRTSQIQNRMKKGNLTPDSLALLNKELQQIQGSNNRLWDSAIQDLAGTLPGNFIKGMKPVRIPVALGKPDNKDNQVKQYQYVRAHFFDEVDFADDRLLRTPLMETKLDQYFKQVVPPVPDTIIQDAGRIIERAKASQNIFQFTVQYLFNLYTDPEIMGTDAVYVYIAEHYYLTGQTPWIDSANLRGIRIRVEELKPLLLGTVTPSLEALVDKDEQPFEIKDIKSKYLVLFFWSPDCGFCKEAAPKLKALYADLKKMGAEVIALNTRVDKEAWIKFITDHDLNWINVYSPKGVKEMIRNYQAFTTPTLYILDNERKIIAKNISVDQIMPFFTQYQANH